MKSETEIRKLLTSRKEDLKNKELEQKGLGQIAQLDSYGMGLDKEIKMLRGEIKGYENVLS